MCTVLDFKTLGWEVHNLDSVLSLLLWNQLFCFHLGGWGSSGFPVSSVIRIKTRETLSGWGGGGRRGSRSKSFGHCDHLEWAFHISLISPWWRMLEWAVCGAPDILYILISPWAGLQSLISACLAGSIDEKQHIYCPSSIQIAEPVCSKATERLYVQQILGFACKYSESVVSVSDVSA